MSKKVSVVFISVLIFWLILAPKSAIIPDSTISGWITNSISLFLVWCVRRDLRYIFTGRYRIFNFSLLAYLAISLYSIYYNADTIGKYELAPLAEDSETIPQGTTTIKYLLYYSIGLFAASLYIQRISDTKYIRTLLKTLFFLLLIVLIPLYREVLITPIEKGVLTEYSFGNKFTIGYWQLFLCTLYYLLHPYLNNTRHKYILSILVLWMIHTSIASECSTMIMGALIFMILSLLTSNAMVGRLASAKTIIISILIFNIGFFFFVTWVLQFEVIQYFVEDILNKDLSLTGRIEIYLDIQEAFTESPWIGLGYGNAIVVAKYYTDAYDTQNGLVELFIQTGVIGVVTFLFLVYTAAKPLEKNNITKYALVAFIYAIIGISTVEIPFKHNFIFFLLFCFIQGQGYQRSHK